MNQSDFEVYGTSASDEIINVRRCRRVSFHQTTNEQQVYAVFDFKAVCTPVELYTKSTIRL